MTAAYFFNECQSGKSECLNPEHSLRPTDLKSQDYESMVSGYCIYCRRGGKGQSDESFSRYLSGMSLTLPTVEDNFDIDEYENFDPQAYDKKNEKNYIEKDSSTDEKDYSSTEDENLSQDLQDFEDSKENREFSEHIANERIKALASKNSHNDQGDDNLIDNNEAKKNRGRPKKNSNLDEIIEDKQKRKRGRPKKEDAETQPDFNEALSESSILEGSVTEEASEVPLAVNPPENNSLAPAAKNNSIPQLKEMANAEMFSKLPPRPTEVMVSSVFKTEREPLPLPPPQTISWWRRLYIGLKEASLGLFDIASSSGRIVVSLLSIPFVLFFAVIQLPAYVLQFKLVKIVKTILKGVKTSLWLLSSAIKPFTDGRLIPSLAFISISAGVIVAPFASPSLSIMFMALGSGSAIGWALWRGLRGAITGGGYQKKDIRWDKDWLNTESLNSLQIHQLNNEFEQVVAEAFGEMGFIANVNGTQKARENGHKGSGDGGVDILLYDSRRRLSVVSCKRYSNPVGEKEVRDIFAVSQGSDYKGSRPILVTTIGFTQPAINFARKNGVLLLKYSDVIFQAKGLSF